MERLYRGAIGLLLALCGAAPSSNLGPYPITKVYDAGYTATDTTLYLELLKDPQDIGGVETNNGITGKWETLRRFLVAGAGFYFEDVQFTRETVNGEYRWFALIEPDDVVGQDFGPHTTQAKLDTVEVSHLICMKGWDQLPIWNGNRCVFSFTTDDGNDDNYAYATPFLQHGVGFSAFINPATIGNATKLTWAEAGSLVAWGNEVGSHGFNHYPHFTTYRRHYVRLRPTSALVTAWTPNPGGTHPGAVNESGFHDGDASYIRAPGDAGGTSNVAETFGLPDVSAIDTLHYGNIDSVAFCGVFRIAGTADDTLAASVNTQIAFQMRGTDACAACNSTTQQNIAGPTYALIREVRTTQMDNSTGWNWDDINAMSAGFRTVDVDNSARCTQFWVDVYFNGDVETVDDDFSTASSDEDTLMGFEIGDSRKAIEKNLTPMDINYRCLGIAAPTSRHDGAVKQAVKAAGFDFMRVGGVSANEPFYSERINSDQYPTWWYMRKYELNRVVTIGQLVGSGASFDSAQVDSATTAILDSYSDLANSANGLVRKNIWMIVLAHDSTEVLPSQLDAMLTAIQNYSVSWWIAPMGTVVNYWNRAELRRKKRY